MCLGPDVKTRLVCLSEAFRAGTGVTGYPSLPESSWGASVRTAWPWVSPGQEPEEVPARPLNRVTGLDSTHRRELLNKSRSSATPQVNYIGMSGGWALRVSCSRLLGDLNVQPENLVGSQTCSLRGFRWGIRRTYFLVTRP